MVYIAIDIGSTYIKSSLLDPHTGEIMNRNRAAVNQKIRQENPLRFEVDMKEMLSSVQTILDGYTSTRNDIEGILLSTQQHGFIYTTPSCKQDRYVSWQDSRCLEPIDESGETTLSLLQKEISVEDMEKTGVYLKPALALCNLYALIQERGGKIEHGAKLYTLGSYLIEKMTGHNVCHITNAAPLGLADIFSGCWYRPLIEKLGFEQIELPRLMTKLEICGYYEANGQKIAVYPDFGDVQTSILGGGAQEGDITVNMATAGQICMIHRVPSIGSGDPRYYEIRPYFDGLYCHTISRMPSGRNLDVLVEWIGEIGRSVFDESLSCAEIWARLAQCGKEKDTHGLSVDTGFYEQPERLADGSITHITRANLTLENLFSAAYQDMGQIYAHYIQLMEKAVDQKPNRMIFCGGAVRNNPTLRSALEHATGLPGMLSASTDEVHEGMMQLARRIEAQKNG